METRKQRQERRSRLLGVTKVDGVLAATNGEAAISDPALVGAEPITEISDEDYRSFCWPCDATGGNG